MDMYYSEDWRAQHPQVAGLFDLVCPSNDPADWRILYAQRGDTWYCLTRGIFGNPDGFYLAWGPEKEELINVLQRHEFLVDWQLTGLVKELEEQYRIDLLAIPLFVWSV